LIVYVCVFAESACFSLSALRSYPAAPHAERKIKKELQNAILKIQVNKERQKLAFEVFPGMAKLVNWFCKVEI
jgi:hypothetical protein